MFKKLILGCLVAAVSLSASGPDPKPTDKKPKKQVGTIIVSELAKKRAAKYEDFMALWPIVAVPLHFQEVAPGEAVDTLFFLKFAKNLEGFVLERPNSFLADDAKFLIASTYNLLYQDREKERQKNPRLNSFADLKIKSNDLLKDLIENHSGDFEFDFNNFTETDEPVAAVALLAFSRWNDNNQVFLKELLTRYPNSRSAKLVMQKPRQ